MSTVFAHTPPGAEYPPYINVTRQPDGQFKVTVRGPKRDDDHPCSPGWRPGHEGSIVLSRAEFIEMVCTLTAAVTGAA